MQELKDMQDEDYQEETVSGPSQDSRSETSLAVPAAPVSDMESAAFC